GSQSRSKRERSPPALNALPSPVRITARTAGSSAAASKASRSAAASSASIALRRSRRASASVRTPSSASERVTDMARNECTVEAVGVAGYAHFLALAQRSQWDENAVELTLDGWTPARRQLLANLCIAEVAVAEELDPIIALAPPEAVPLFELQRGDERRHA